MVLIQLLLPTSAAGADGLAPLARTIRNRYRGLIGQGNTDDPAAVARVGFDPMMRGHGDVVSD